MKSFDSLQKALGYTFKDPQILRDALTHSSYANEHPEEACQDNERMEFIGDAVVGLLAAHAAYLTSGSSEGVLSRQRAQMVCRESLAELALAFQLDEHLRLGKGQARAGIASSDRLLADAFESLVGAVYLDGGLDACKACFSEKFQSNVNRTWTADAKTRLQEFCHAKQLPVPQYLVLRSSGPDHAKEYECAVVVNGERVATAVAPSKRIAEQACAAAALMKLNDQA